MMRICAFWLLWCSLLCVPGFSASAQGLASCKGDLRDHLFNGMADRHIGFQFPSDIPDVTGIMNSNDDFSYSCLAKQGQVSIRFIVGKRAVTTTLSGLLMEYRKKNPSSVISFGKSVVLLGAKEKTVAIISSGLDIDYKAFVVYEIPEANSNLWKSVRFFQEVQR